MKRAWLFVFLLSVVGCLNYLDRIMITTMRSSILESIPMTDAQFGLLTSVFLWVYGVLSPVGGFLADRFKRSTVIICSLLIWSTVTWMTSLATTFQELLITRALMGASEACYIPAALAFIVDYHRGKTQSLAVGIHMAGVIIGQALGFLGGWMAENYTWDFAFHFFGLFGVAYAIVLFFILKDAPPVKAPTTLVAQTNKINLLGAIANLFSYKGFLIAWCFWGLFSISGWLIIGWLPTYYKEHFELSQTTSGLYATGYLYSASLAGVLIGGFLADKYSKNFSRARILVPAVGLLVAAPCIYLASTTSLLAVAIGGFMLYAFMRAFSDANMMPILCLVTEEKY